MLLSNTKFKPRFDSDANITRNNQQRQVIEFLLFFPTVFGSTQSNFQIKNYDHFTEVLEG